MRVEQRDVLFGAALPFQIDGEQVGTACEQEPDHLPTMLRVPHELRDLREHPIGHATVAGRRAIP